MTDVVTYVLDAGALTAVERADTTMTAILQRVREGRAGLVLPDAVVAQVWRGGRQARLAAVLGLKADRCRAVPLDRDAATAIGRGIRDGGHSDIVDIQVALLAREHNGLVVTSDRDDILAAAPELDRRIVDV